MAISLAAEKLLTAEQLARHLGVPPQSIRLMARRGDIPAYRIGRWWRFDLGRVLEVLESKEG